jgi:hypothetical protein
MGMIGGAVAGVLAIAVVAGYFAMARVDSIKSETAAATQRSQDATTEAAAVTSQVQSLGQPIVDSDKQLAQGQEQVLVAAYTERHDFVLLSQELKAIMEGTKGWYQLVEATSAGTDGASEVGVKIVGYMPTKELMAGFNERANATKSLANAEIVAIETERLTDVDSRRPGIYFKFTMTADLVDTVAPSATTVGGGVDSNGQTVSSGGSGELSLSLESKPKPKPAAAAAPAKPKNPFDIAASVAGGGS